MVLRVAFMVLVCSSLVLGYAIDPRDKINSEKSLEERSGAPGERNFRNEIEQRLRSMSQSKSDFNLGNYGMENLYRNIQNRRFENLIPSGQNYQDYANRFNDLRTSLQNRRRMNNKNSHDRDNQDSSEESHENSYSTNYRSKRSPQENTDFLEERNSRYGLEQKDSVSESQNERKSSYDNRRQNSNNYNNEESRRSRYRDNQDYEGYESANDYRNNRNSYNGGSSDSDRESGQGFFGNSGFGQKAGDIASRFRNAASDTYNEEKKSVRTAANSVKDLIGQDIRTHFDLAKTAIDMGLIIPKFGKNFISQN